MKASKNVAFQLEMRQLCRLGIASAPPESAAKPQVFAEKRRFLNEGLKAQFGLLHHCHMWLNSVHTAANEVDVNL
jgi:hypothetical protein